MWRLHYQLSREGRRRFFDELLPLLHDTKHEVLGDRAESCYYLVYIGTRPSGRRRGYARRLIDHAARKVCCSSSIHVRMRTSTHIHTRTYTHTHTHTRKRARSHCGPIGHDAPPKDKLPPSP